MVPPDGVLLLKNTIITKMLQYQIQNKVKRRGKYEIVLMTKYILDDKELAGIDRFLGNMDDLTADNIRKRGDVLDVSHKSTDITGGWSNFID